MFLPITLDVMEALMSDTSQPTIPDLAAVAAGCFETATAQDGHEYVRIIDGSPEWVTDLVRDAHGSPAFLPDDWRYAFARDALDYIAELMPDADLFTPAHVDHAYEFAAERVVVYSHDLLAWLSSNPQRAGYCAEYAEPPETLMEMVAAAGQFAERREVFALVAASLNDRVAAFAE